MIFGEPYDGILVGFLLAQIVNIIVVSYRCINKRIYRSKLYSSIINEISEGISRCNYLIKSLSEDTLSFSRIYTKYWDSMVSDIINIKDIKTLLKLHNIYRNFDLINFNMNRGEFGIGAAHAKIHIDEINEDFIFLKCKQNIV